MTSALTPEELAQAGLHFGHKSQRIHPKARPFIWKNQQGISIIDLFKTTKQLDEAVKFAFDLGAQGKILLVAATKKQARKMVADLCQKNEIFFLTNKWIGGFLTNFEEVSKNIKRFREMKKEESEGLWNKLVKHERIARSKKLKATGAIYGGVQLLTRPPDALFIIDVKREKNCLSESIRLSLPTIALVDTNSDPTLITYPIVGNDDALSSIELVTETVIKAYIEGRKKQ